MCAQNLSVAQVFRKKMRSIIIFLIITIENFIGKLAYKRYFPNFQLIYYSFIDFCKSDISISPEGDVSVITNSVVIINCTGELQLQLPLSAIALFAGYTTDNLMEQMNVSRKTDNSGNGLVAFRYGPVSKKLNGIKLQCKNLITGNMSGLTTLYVVCKVHKKFII